MSFTLVGCRSNGLQGVADLRCEGTTRPGARCRNPVWPYGQMWSGSISHFDMDTADPRTQQLAQRRCHVHVDRAAPLDDVRLVFTDVEVGSR